MFTDANEPVNGVDHVNVHGSGAAVDQLQLALADRDSIAVADLPEASVRQPG